MSLQVNQTRKLVTIAILSALSFVLMLFSFPLIPGADFLKIELSILPILIALTLFELKSAYAVLVVRTMLKFLLNNRGIGDVIGLPMNVIAVGTFVLVFAWFWKRHQSPKTFMLSSILGTLLLAGVMVLLNWFFAIPLYASLAGFDIGQTIGIQPYLFGMVIPFNLIEGVMFSATFGLLYLPLRPTLTKHQRGQR